MPPLDWKKEAKTIYWWQEEPNSWGRQSDPGLYEDYEDYEAYEDSFENVAGAEPGQRYG